MKILFINPCLRHLCPIKLLPVGIASVMTYVKNHGYDFDFLDIDINDYTDDYVEEFIKNNEYDVILYGTLVTHYKWVKWLTRTIKMHHPKTRIVVGNSVAGSCYDVFLKNTPADVVVIGEGEVTCAAVLDAFKGNTNLKDIHGIAFRDEKGQIVKTPPRKAANINDLPMIEWNFFDIPSYVKKDDPALFGGQSSGDKPNFSMPVVTARGCAFRCTFCHFVFWDDPYRYRSPDKVLIEVRRNIEKYNATGINFWDDLSFASLPQVENFVDAVLESGLKFQWSAAIRTDLFGHPRNSSKKRREVAKKMKDSGCVTVGYSLESGNEKILEMMNKKVTTEYFEEQIKVLDEVGIISFTAVVFGYPIETSETIQETFAMCLKNKVYPSIGFLLPLPYTEMYEYAKEHGYITNEDAYLEEITERQDICLNMTKMADEEIMGEIKKGAAEINALLNLGFDESSFIKTAGKQYRADRQGKNISTGLDPVKIKRIENDVSFNYSEATFNVSSRDSD
jgi:anaerobic magnesium-protoporphyrin IX monomethyl ester cyclase